MNNSLNKNGLSMSQAQSISNLCNQNALEISRQLESINNYHKLLQNSDKSTTQLTVGNPIPENILELLQQKAKYHACQAFLMENIKIKENLLKQIKQSSADISKIDPPHRDIVLRPAMLQEVDLSWGKSQLTASELNKLINAEAYASHIGQFIHAGCKLAELREELSNLNLVEWMELTTGTKTPVLICQHHSSERLLTVHNTLAAEHRGYEQQVNYFKAKIQNLTTHKNAEIAKINADAINEYTKQSADVEAQFKVESDAYNSKINKMRTDFEIARQEQIKEVANLKIEVDPLFQEIVTKFLTT